MTTKYKVLNKRPLIMSVSPELIEPPRLDVDYYRPQFVEAVERVQQSGLPLEPLDNLRVSQRIITDGIRKHTKTKSGVVLIRTQNFDEVTLNLDECVYVDHTQHLAAQKSAVRTGDLLIAVRGYLGKAVIVGPDVPTANINQHIARVSVNEKKADAGYLWAFFSSTLGKTLLEQQVTGTVQQGIMLPAMRQFQVPIAPRPIQTYIGAKVRLAEQCREEAYSCLGIAKRSLKETIGFNLFDDKIASTISNFGQLHKVISREPDCVLVSSKVIGNALAAERYAPSDLARDEMLRIYQVKMAYLGDIGRDFVNGHDCRDFKSEGTPYLRVGNIKQNELSLEGVAFISRSVDSLPKKFQMVTGDLLITRKGSFGICTTALPKMTKMVFSSEIIRVPLKDGWDSDYVALFLNSPFGRFQFDRLATGTTMKGINHENLAEVGVPTLTFEAQKVIGASVRKFMFLKEKANHLITEAKTNVEALIEGRLDVEGINAGQVQPPSWEEVERELA
jgi:restriction endonuclease S subunit